MYSYEIIIDYKGKDRRCKITSKDATMPFRISYLDVDFIQEDIWNYDSSNGELEVVVDDGIINVYWEIV